MIWLCTPRICGVGAEHHAAVALDAQRLKAVVGGVEVFRHTALAADPVLESDALELAVQRIVPGMVDTRERRLVVALLQAHQRALVRAPVDHRVHGPVFVARHDDGCIAQPRRLDVAGLAHFTFHAQVVPHRSTKNLLLLHGIDLLVGEDLERDTCHATFRPAEPRGRHGGCGRVRYDFGCGRAGVHGVYKWSDVQAFTHY